MSKLKYSWVKPRPKTWETEEGMDGTPDFIITKESDGYRVKARSSAKATRGFERLEEAKSYCDNWGVSSK